MDEETYVGLSDAPSVDLGKDFVCFCPHIVVELANASPDFRTYCHQSRVSEIVCSG